MNEQSPLAPVLQAIDVRKRFYQGSTEVLVLNGVDSVSYTHLRAHET